MTLEGKMDKLYLRKVGLMCKAMVNRAIPKSIIFLFVILTNGITTAKPSAIKNLDTFISTNHKLLNKCIAKSDASDFNMRDCNFSYTKKIDAFLADNKIIPKNKIQEIKINKKIYCDKQKTHLDGGSSEELEISICWYTTTIREIYNYVYQSTDFEKILKNTMLSNKKNYHLEIKKIQSHCTEAAKFWTDMSGDKNIYYSIYERCYKAQQTHAFLKLI
jgi:hypothetical protein